MDKLLQQLQHYETIYGGPVASPMTDFKQKPHLLTEKQSHGIMDKLSYMTTFRPIPSSEQYGNVRACPEADEMTVKINYDQIQFYRMASECKAAQQPKLQVTFSSEEDD